MAKLSTCKCRILKVKDHLPSQTNAHSFKAMSNSMMPSLNSLQTGPFAEARRNRLAEKAGARNS